MVPDNSSQGLCPLFSHTRALPKFCGSHGSEYVIKCFRPAEGRRKIKNLSNFSNEFCLHSCFFLEQCTSVLMRGLSGSWRSSQDLCPLFSHKRLLLKLCGSHGSDFLALLANYNDTRKLHLISNFNYQINKSTNAKSLADYTRVVLRSCA